MYVHILRLFYIFSGRLVYLVVIWCIFPRFGMLYQKSGNPGTNFSHGSFEKYFRTRMCRTNAVRTSAAHLQTRMFPADSKGSPGGGDYVCEHQPLPCPIPMCMCIIFMYTCRLQGDQMSL
jgi:hypothetical protein